MSHMQMKTLRAVKTKTSQINVAERDSGGGCVRQAEPSATATATATPSKPSQIPGFCFQGHDRRFLVLSSQVPTLPRLLSFFSEA